MSADSEPFSSPMMLSGPGASPILVFGSQGSDFLHAFDPIFVLARHHTQLQSFISFALEAVRAEIQSVANVPIGLHDDSSQPRFREIELLPHLPPFRIFSDLRSLVSYHAETNRTDPVVNGILLCLLHAANTVAVHCARADVLDSPMADIWTAMSHPHAHLLGLCTGALSSWAAGMISEADPGTIWSFMQAAVLSLRVCFWVGLHSKAARCRLARESQNVSSLEGRWSTVVTSAGSDNVIRLPQLLDQFHTAIHKVSIATLLSLSTFELD